MTLQQITQAIYRRVKLSDTPSTTDVTRITQFVNLWYRRILAMPGMDRLRDTTLTFNSVVSQKQYGLPAAISRVRDIYDLTNQRRIMPRTMDWVRNVDPGLTATSSFVENWIPLQGWGATLVVPNQAGVPLWVSSSSGGDTTQHAFVETVRVNGVRAGTTGPTTLNGTTPVQLGTLADHIEVIKFYLDAAPGGVISLFDAQSSGNLLSYMPVGRTNARFFMIQLYPTPGAVVNYSVDCQIGIQDLVQNNEEPLLPEDFHHVLVEFGTFEEWCNRDDDRQKVALAEGMQILSDMRHYLLTNPDEIPVQRGPRALPQRISRLGGWFPSDSTMLG